jgi:hypothetical protein
MKKLRREFPDFDSGLIVDVLNSNNGNYDLTREQLRVMCGGSKC